MNQVRLTYDERRKLIINAGVEIANRHGLTACTMFAVARQCSDTIPTSIPTVRSYFRTKSDLWRSVVGHAKASQAVRKDAASLGLTA